MHPQAKTATDVNKEVQAAISPTASMVNYTSLDSMDSVDFNGRIIDIDIGVGDSSPKDGPPKDAGGRKDAS